MLWCSLSYAKIRYMKWLLRRFCTIRGFLYVSMRFYTLGILHEIFEHESHELNEFFIALGSHTDLTLEFFWTRIIRITRIIFVHADLTLFNAHGSHRSHGSANASHGSRMSFFVPHYKSKNPIIKNCRRQRSVRSVRSVCNKLFVLFGKFVFRK